MYLSFLYYFQRSGPCAECQVWLQGNMKQHMLTHKIRDMPAHLFDQQQQQQQQRGEGAATGGGPLTSHQVIPPPPPTPTTPTPPMPMKEDAEVPARPPSEPSRQLESTRSSQDSSDEAPPAKRPTPPDHSEPLPAPKRPHSQYFFFSYFQIKTCEKSIDDYRLIF